LGQVGALPDATQALEWKKAAKSAPNASAMATVLVELYQAVHPQAMLEAWSEQSSGWLANIEAGISRQTVGYASFALELARSGFEKSLFTAISLLF